IWTDAPRQTIHLNTQVKYKQTYILLGVEIKKHLSLCLSPSGSDSVQIRSSRAAAVCLLLLCVLLTAVIVLNMLYLKTSFSIRCTLGGNNELITELVVVTDGWLRSNFRFYFISSLKKSWTESRKYCTERGADLIIINNREKQVSERYCVEFWIGVTDIKEEGRWEWVDGTSVTSGFWASSGQISEPNGGRQENCAVTYLKKHPELIGWIDVTCNGAYQWICEKSV
uniref:C-type lectin domain-containing protein n=1 Tax=Sinocyclocheilus anshuiensis TaxID=1608454 RepID=A0A671N4Y2_9TELE